MIGGTFLSRQWEVIVMYFYWEAGHCADVVANIGANKRRVVIFMVLFSVLIRCVVLMGIKI